MTPLKWIVNEAKKLKKQYPNRFKKWTDYVAQASAIYASKHKGKSPVGKKHKVSGVTKKAAKKKVVKKSVLRKKAVKKSSARMLHKDTKSHNVNIRVMSGMGAISDEIIHTIKLYDKKREYHEKEYKKWKENAKHYGRGKNNPSLKYAREHKNLVNYYSKQIAKLRLKIK
jgi:hypothetical protein